MIINCLLAGVGGQGTVLASKLIAQTALQQGLQVRTSETIGMSQRGGCVASHVRLGDKVYSPLIPLAGADLVIGFEPAEALRYLPYLKPDGVMIVSTTAIKPVSDSLAKTDYRGEDMLEALRAHVQRLVVLDGNAIITACGSPKVLNTALLGAAAEAGVLGFGPEALEETLRAMLPAKYLTMNLNALHVGALAYREGEH